MGLMTRRMWSCTHDGEGLPRDVKVLRHEDGLLVVEVTERSSKKRLRGFGFRFGDPVRRLKREAVIVDAIKLTLSELFKALIAGDFDDMLPQLLAAEETGKNRTGAKSAIKKRLQVRG